MSGSHESEVWVDDYVTSTGIQVTGHWRKRSPRGSCAEAELAATSTTSAGAGLVEPGGHQAAGGRGLDTRPRPASTPGSAAPPAVLDEDQRRAKVAAGLQALRQRRSSITTDRDNHDAASDHPPVEQVETAGQGSSQCPSCGQFQGEGHTCPMPEGLPAGNYADIKGEDRTKQMLADLQDSVAAIVQSGQLSRWLDAMASNGLNRWSFNNRMLSVLQVLQRDPNGELHLMGFRQWDKYNRKVRKGEKAVWILAPMTRKIREEGDDGKVRERTIVTGFKSVPVFNIDQTDGDPMPDSIVSHADGEARAGTLEGLRDRIAQSGYSYEESEIPDYRGGKGTLGYTDPQTKKIVVDARLNSAQKASTIAHELGHVHCGHVDGDYSEYVQHRGRMETEAEMTAYMVNRARGMNRSQADSFSPGYIAGWSRGKAEVITGAMDRATKAFNKIMDGPWSSSTTKE
jgi:antirestriction protein ArdC